MQQGIVLEGLIEVALAVEDRQGDVAARREDALELLGAAHPEHFEARLPQLRADGHHLLMRERHDDCVPAHFVSFLLIGHAMGGFN